MTKGFLNLADLLNHAIMDNEESVKALFQGFIAESEEVIDCGYLGTLGIIFPEHSFWCITSERLCSLRIKNGGEMSFTSAYLEYINSNAFYQPSLLKLILLLVVSAATTMGIAILIFPMIIKTYYQVNKSGAVFWVKNGIPIYIYADRDYLKRAQKIAIITINLRNKDEMP